MLISQYDVFDGLDNATPPSITWTILDPTTDWANDALKYLAPGSIVIQVTSVGDNNCGSCEVVEVYLKMYPTPDTVGYDGSADYRPMLSRITATFQTASPVSGDALEKRMPLGAIYIRDADGDGDVDGAFIKVRDTGSDVGSSDWHHIPIMNEAGGIRVGGTAGDANAADSATVGGIGNDATGQDAATVGGAGIIASGADAVAIGGTGNEAAGDNSVVAGGTQSEATGVGSFTAGANTGSATGEHAAVVGGYQNNATGQYAAVVGGFGHVASGADAGCFAGAGNTVQADYAAAIGGRGNVIETGKTDAVAIGGRDHLIGGIAGVGIGHKCDINHNYAILLNAADGASGYGSGSDLFSSLVESEIAMRASGGYRMYTNDAESAGVYMAGGAGTWSSVSDERTKEIIGEVEADVLDGYRRLRILEYMQGQDHIGAGITAQEYYALFSVARERRFGDMLAINQAERDGIQDLAIKQILATVDYLVEENTSLRKRIARLERHLNADQ